MAAGDETAYRRFYDAYFDRLLRYLLVVTGGNEEAAREALQLALVRVVRHVKVFESEDKFWSWLTVLARSALADESRKRRRYFAFLERFTRHQDTGPSAMDNGEADERLRALLESKLTALPEDERQLVEEKYILCQSVREIADGQQTTEKAVESRLSRVRRKLKDAVLAELKNEQPTLTTEPCWPKCWPRRRRRISARRCWRRRCAWRGGGGNSARRGRAAGMLLLTVSLLAVLAAQHFSKPPVGFTAGSQKKPDRKVTSWSARSRCRPAHWSARGHSRQPDLPRPFQKSMKSPRSAAAFVSSTMKNLLALLADKPAVLIRTGPQSEELVFANPEDQKGFPLN